MKAEESVSVFTGELVEFDPYVLLAAILLVLLLMLLLLESTIVVKELVTESQHINSTTGIQTNGTTNHGVREKNSKKSESNIRKLIEIGECTHFEYPSLSL